MVIQLVHCLAYGSNLHPDRLRERVRSAKPIGVVPMPGKRLAFHKRSIDGSGKCNFYDTGDTLDILYTVLYEFNFAEKRELDRLEGLGSGYTDPVMDVQFKGETYNAFIYVADPEYLDDKLVPNHQYKEMVVLGARYHGLPTDYIARIEAVESRPNPDPARVAKDEKSLAKMRQTNGRKGS